MLRQARLRTSVATENTKAAETGTVPKTGTEIRRGTEVKTVTGEMGTGLPPGITGVTSLADTGMNVNTGRLGTGRGLETTLETDLGRILVVKMLSSGPGHKKFCLDHLRPGCSCT